MSSSHTKLTVRSAADLVCTVPYLLGFHPGEGSVVFVACAHTRIVFAARTDLPTPDERTTTLRALTDNLLPVLREQRTTDIVIVGYGAASHIDPALRLLEQTFTAAGVPIRDLLRVADSRVFHPRCDNPACCPAQGTPFDPSAAPIAVRATVAGLVAYPDRAAVAARIAPVDGAAREDMRRATERAVTRLATLRATGHTDTRRIGARTLRDALRQHDAGHRLTDDETAWLTVLVARTAVRDAALDLTQPHEGHVAFWADVTRRAQQRFVPAPATLLALTAWRCGNGALASMAAEHALRADPAYRLARLVLHAIQAGIPPTVFEQETAADADSPDPTTDTAHPDGPDHE